MTQQPELSDGARPPALAFFDTSEDDKQLANVPLPAGAVRVGGWEHPNSTGLPQSVRYFDGTARDVTGDQRLPLGDGRTKTVTVRIKGCQWGDGTVERDITVHELHWEDGMSIAVAAELADSICGAVNEAISMAKLDPPPINSDPDPGPILEALNSYDGTNIWTDVIDKLPGFDADTAWLRPHAGGTYGARFIADRVEYRYLSFTDEWVAWQRVDVDDVVPEVF
jgi:hypothetical protein